ncbi:MAG: four-carbon acid sugar kinase family protein [Candidatus Bathyarchaeia archaeon]
MAKLGVIADDLTGASDTGVQFSKLGLRTIVVWELSYTKKAAGTTDVLVVDTESRADDPEIAYMKAKEAATSLLEVGVYPVFKKIDSTLRGNIGAELDGVCDAMGDPVVFVAPAFPRNRRTTVKGYQLLDGVQLEHSFLKYDRLAPVGCSHIASIIRKQSRRLVKQIPLKLVSSGIASLQSRIRSWVKSGFRIFVLDAVTNAHLNTIAMAASRFSSTVLLCGSAGLAEEIPYVINLIPEGGQVLVVAGSLSEVTKRQVTYIEKCLKTSRITVNLDSIIRSKYSRVSEVERAVNLLRRELDTTSVGILTLEKSATHMTEKTHHPEHVETPSRHVILETLGHAAAEAMRPELSGIVVTGGDTAMAVVKAIGAYSIKLEDEVEAGVAAGTLSGGPWSGTRILTKAGAFGDDSTLLRALCYLRRRQTFRPRS